MMLKSVKQRLLLVLMFFLFSGLLFAQVPSSERQKVVLKSGKSYVGEVLVNTPDLLIVKLDDGSRFQFKMSEVLQIHPSSAAIVDPSLVVSTESAEGAFISAAIDVSAGLCMIKNRTNAAPFTQLSLVFGTDKIDQETIFLGLGVAYSHAFVKQADAAFSFVPVYVQLKKKLQSPAFAPILGLDLGYAFATKEEYRGGVYSKLSVGFMQQLNHQTSAHLGLFAGAQLLSAPLEEQFNDATHSYYGTSSMLSIGLSIGLRF